MCQPLIVDVWYVLDRIQHDGIITNKQTTAACAFLDDPYQSATIGAVIYLSCVSEQIDGPDFKASPVLKGSPPDMLLVGGSATSPGRPQCL